MRTNSKSVTVYVYGKNGGFIGKWPSIAEAAKGNNATASSVSNGVWSDTHFSIGRYWITEKDNIEEVIKKHREYVASNKKRTKLARTKNKNEKINHRSSIERNGSYIFVESGLPGNECCVRCALCYADDCLPCRIEEGHKHGYWRYSKPVLNI